jgi:hypothetical protein
MPHIRTQEIPRSNWSEYLSGFSRDHAGDPVIVEVIGRQIGTAVEARCMTFEGIAAEIGEGHEDTIFLMVGEEPDKHITHSISAPSHIRLEQVGEGATPAQEVLQIESERDPMTLIRFGE